MKEITLQVNGREMTFEVAQTPTEGKLFEVNPTKINQSLFSKKRTDRQQERTRKFILEAFAEMKNNPKYERPFKTLIPERTWDLIDINGLRKIACNFGNHIADWVEQSLEQAQRIVNGETWEKVCNKSDTANCRRMILGKDGYYDPWIVGGSCKYNNNTPSAFTAELGGFDSEDILFFTVPLVVLY